MLKICWPRLCCCSGVRLSQNWRRCSCPAVRHFSLSLSKSILKADFSFGGKEWMSHNFVWWFLLLLVWLFLCWCCFFLNLLVLLFYVIAVVEIVVFFMLMLLLVLFMVSLGFVVDGSVSVIVGRPCCWFAVAWSAFVNVAVAILFCYFYISLTFSLNDLFAILCT